MKYFAAKSWTKSFWRKSSVNSKYSRGAFLALALVTGLALEAQAQPPAPSHRLAPYFEHTLIMGHAISTGLMRGIMGHRFGESPADILSRDYVGKGQSTNIGEGAGLDIESGYAKIYRMNFNMQNEFEPWEQLRPSTKYRDIELMKKAYAKATAIVGVDLFYMDVAFNTCASEHPVAIRNNLRAFIEQAHADGKLVILGNVPNEDWTKTKPIARLIVKQKWSESCRKIFNAALQAECRPELNCHILNMEKIVDDLNRTDKITLKNGKSYHANYNSYFWWLTNQVRPDGINVSQPGAQHLAEQMLDTIEGNFARLEAGRAPTPTESPEASGLR